LNNEQKRYQKKKRRRYLEKSEKRYFTTLQQNPTRAFKKARFSKKCNEHLAQSNRICKGKVKEIKLDDNAEQSKKFAWLHCVMQIHVGLYVYISTSTSFPNKEIMI